MKWRYLAGSSFSFSLQYDFFYFFFSEHLLARSLSPSLTLFLSLSCVPCILCTHTDCLCLWFCVFIALRERTNWLQDSKYIHIFLINSASAFAKEETQHQTRFADVVRCLVANLLSKPYDKWTEKYSNYWCTKGFWFHWICATDFFFSFFVFFLLFFIFSHACAHCELQWAAVLVVITINKHYIK